jgi:uncharacterized protein YndB with AHSA1/START domain
MRLTIDTLLERPREVVWRVFDDPENLPKWQPSLRRIERQKGSPGQVGAVSRLFFSGDGHDLKLTETVTGRREPEEFLASYDSGHTHNTVHHRFIDLGDGRTRWLVEAEFQFKGFLRLASLALQGTIEKRLRGDVARFKALVEAGEMGAGPSLR